MIPRSFRLTCAAVPLLLALACGGGGNSTPANHPPSANAGAAQTAIIGTPVTLDGTGSSDPDGNPLTFAWNLIAVPSGSAAALSSPSTAKPSFTPDVAGTYTASLVVSDGKLSSAASTVNIVASLPNRAPLANAGTDQAATTGTTVTLDGTASSDPDGNTLTFSWNLAVPGGSTATLVNPATAKPTFTPDVAGTYTATLVVSDGKLNSAPATVNVVAKAPDHAPFALASVAGGTNVATGQPVTLDGSASYDPDGDPLTFAWSLDSKPSGSTAALDNATAVKPTFTPDLEGTYNVSLSVSDGTLQNPCMLTITATAPKRLNVAYPTPSGMSITVTQFQVVDSGTYNSMNISYVQANPSLTAFVDEGYWILVFTDGTSEMQYGFFNRVAPGGSLPRSYTWQETKDKVPAKLVYADFLDSSTTTWSLPFPG